MLLHKEKKKAWWFSDSLTLDITQLSFCIQSLSYQGSKQKPDLKNF